MTTHTLGTRDEWLAARLELLKAEKELTRLSDELARRRRDLPWVRVEEDYRFDTEDGEATLADLFGGRSQLLVYHFMFDPDWDEGCPSCSASRRRLRRQHLALRAPRRRVRRGLAGAAREAASRTGERMGWGFPWVSSFGSSFNYDFHATIDPAVAPVEYNYRDQAQLEADNVAWRDWSGEQPGMSAFARDGDGVVFHTYSAYARGFDATVADVAVARPRAARAATRATCRGSVATTSTRPATDDGGARRRHPPAHGPEAGSWLNGTSLSHGARGAGPAPVRPGGSAGSRRCRRRWTWHGVPRAKYWNWRRGCVVADAACRAGPGRRGRGRAGHG